MIPQRRLAAIRAMHADFEDRLRKMDLSDVDLSDAYPSDREALEFDVLVGALAHCVPDLLDEIERLKDGVPEPHHVVLKMDSQTGWA